MMLFFVTFGALAETTNTLSDAEIQGRALAMKIISAKPESGSIDGVMKIRQGGTNVTYPFRLMIQPFGNTNWVCHYIFSTNLEAITNEESYYHHVPVGAEVSSWLMVMHSNDNSISYGSFTLKTTTGSAIVDLSKDYWTSGKQSWQSVYRNSDFWNADLGLEFFHWPQQKVLKREVHSSRGCTVLESTNPDPSTNGYSRVKSWIDTETLGIVEAYAYDTKGKELKIFTPKDFKKVDGQWQVQTFLMENVQTGSRSRLEFDLKK